MRRLAAAILFPVTAAAAIAGCGGSAAPASANASVAVSGPVGRAPQVRIPATRAGGGLVTKTVVKGHGPVLAAADSYLANFNLYLWRGKTHKLVFSSYASTPEVLPVQIGLSGLQRALHGQRIGSRVLAVLPPAFGYGSHGNPQIGVAPTDTLVWVIDLLQAYSPTAHATGAKLGTGGGKLPTVTANAAGTPVIAIPRSAPPAKLVADTLIKGTGAPVRPGQSLVVKYTGEIWGNGRVFDTNWPSASSPASVPRIISLGRVIPGWAIGLAGVPVGSRVLLVVPPADGYKKAGNPQAGITGTDTLVFVVDVLGAVT